MSSGRRTAGANEGVIIKCTSGHFVVYLRPESSQGRSVGVYHVETLLQMRNMQHYELLKS